MKNLLFVLIGVFSAYIFLSILDDHLFTRSYERGYYNGQVNALNGDISIEKNSDSVYVWKNSEGKIYNPPKIK